MISPPIFDPNAKTEWVPAPEGTEPDDVQQAVMDSISNLNTSDELWTSVIGSFGIGVTVSSIDCENHSVVLDIWMYNCMSHQSLGRFATNTLFSLSGQRNQYMWWNWQEEHTWK